jgi:hypothetical protein
LESLIGAVRDRIEDSLLQIREINRAIQESKIRGLKPEESLKLKQRMRSLQLRHKTWVTELTEITTRFDHALIDTDPNLKKEDAA